MPNRKNMGQKKLRKYVKPRKFKQYVPGWGGAIGRGIGMAQKAWTSKGSIAHRALALARKVADAVNIEYKYFDLTNAGGTIDYTGGVGILNAITAGTGDSQRIGDSVKVQNDFLRFFLVRNGQDCFVRVMVYWDDQNKTSTPADVLEVTGSSLSVISPKKYDKRFQTKVVFDKMYALTTNVPEIRDQCLLKIDQHTQFDAASTTINIGALKLLVISNVVTINLPALTYYSRCTYTDN